MTTTHTTTDDSGRQAAVELRQARRLQNAEAIIKEIEGASIGYIGNVYPDGTDDRSWCIFLAHPGRCGGLSDRLGGFPTSQRGDLLTLAHTLRMGFELGKLGIAGRAAAAAERDRRRF